MRLAAAPLSPLRHRRFRLFWGAQSISLLGDRFHDVALAWLVLQLSGGFTALGGILAARAVAATLLLLLGGAVVDALTPARLMVASAAGRFLLMAMVVGLLSGGRAALWQLFLLEAGFGVADAFARPAEGSIVPGLVAPRELEAAGALGAVSENVSRLAGPILAGAVVAGSGTTIAFAADAASFGAALLLLARIRRSPDVQPAPTRRRDRRIGPDIRRAVAEPAVRTMLLLWVAGGLAMSGSYLVGLPALAHGRFGGGALTLGALLSAWGLGQLGGNVAGAVRGQPTRPGVVVGVATLLCGLAWSSLAVDAPLALALAMIGLAGFADGISEVVAPAWVQRAADPALLGRVMGNLELARSLAYPVSMLAAGALVGPAPTLLFLFSGLVLVGAGSVCAVRWSLGRGEGSGEPPLPPSGTWR